MLICGVDPGKFGAIAILEEGKIIHARSLPQIGDGLDFRAIVDLIPILNVQYVFLEKVHAIFGASATATFEFGVAYGVARMLASKYPHTLVPPKTWQKEVWQGITPVYKPTKDGKRRVDTKKMSLLAVTQLFPDWDFRVRSEKTGNFLSKYHEGQIDAALIALYGHRLLTQVRDTQPSKLRLEFIED